MERIKVIEKEIAELKDKLNQVQGTETEVYTRIVGYYRSVRNWNKGKRSEYSKRLTYHLPVHCPDAFQENNVASAIG